jgi:germination protein M
VQVFFTAGGKLAPESAQVSSDTPASAALGLLLEGPKAAGHFTDIPKGTQLQKVSIADHTAEASFDQAFFSSGGASGVTLRLGQVVYTLTQFPEVTSVQFLRDGQPAGVIGEGFPLNRPLTRDQFASVQP